MGLTDACATAAAAAPGLGPFHWEHLATIAAGIGAALVAAGVAVWGYRVQQPHARDERRAAMRAVEDYLEGPYRIRRRDGSAEQRAQVTTRLSDVKSRINYYRALMDLHAPGAVAQCYDEFARAAQGERAPR